MSTTDRSGRHALWGAIFGALVGGVLSFCGSYFTNQTQEQRQYEELRRASYVKVISQAEKRRISLMRVEQAIEAKNPEAYKKVYDKGWEDAADLYTATSEAAMLLSKDEYDALWKITNEFFKAPVEERYQDVDVSAVKDARRKGTDAMINFVDQGRKQFSEEESGFLERFLP